MSISFQCKKCGKQYRMKSTSAGKSFACKSCGAMLKVPPAARNKKPQEELDPWEQPELPAASLPGRKTKSKKPTLRKNSGIEMSPRSLVSLVLALVLLPVGGGLLYWTFSGNYYPWQTIVPAEEFQQENWKLIVDSDLQVEFKMPENEYADKPAKLPDGTVHYNSMPDKILGYAIDGWLDQNWCKCEFSGNVQSKHASAENYYKSVTEKIKSEENLLEEKDINIKGLAAKEYISESHNGKLRTITRSYFLPGFKYEYLARYSEPVQSPNEKRRNNFFGTISIRSEILDEAVFNTFKRVRIDDYQVSVMMPDNEFSVKPLIGKKNDLHYSSVENDQIPEDFTDFDFICNFRAIPYTEGNVDCKEGFYAGVFETYKKISKNRPGYRDVNVNGIRGKRYYYTESKKVGDQTKEIKYLIWAFFRNDSRKGVFVEFIEPEGRTRSRMEDLFFKSFRFDDDYVSEHDIACWKKISIPEANVSIMMPNTQSAGKRKFNNGYIIHDTVPESIGYKLFETPCVCKISVFISTKKSRPEQFYFDKQAQFLEKFHKKQVDKKKLNYNGVPAMDYSLVLDKINWRYSYRRLYLPEKKAIVDLRFIEDLDIEIKSVKKQFFDSLVIEKN